MLCENCEKSHDGSYGSGRFCCSKCARGFSTKSKRQEINDKVSKKLKGDSRCAWNKGKKYQLEKTKKQKPFVKQCEFCFICYEPHNRNKKQKYCSIFCANKIINQKAYKNGRKVSGGRTKWLEYKDFKVQGTYELRTCIILDRWKEENKILYWEYTNDRVTYKDSNGKNRRYLLDFKVIDLDGNPYYVETKGFIRENDELKWQALRDSGKKLEIWYLEDIKKHEAHW